MFNFSEDKKNPVDILRETLFDLHIKKHLWRPPKLHRDLTTQQLPSTHLNNNNNTAITTLRGNSFTSFTSSNIPTNSINPSNLNPNSNNLNNPNFPNSNISYSSPFEVETRYQSHRSETWYELFYDLIFVASALQIGHIAQADISFEGIMKSGLLFAIMRATWDQLMFYQNRFDTKDMLHYIFYLIQAMCAFIMAEHLTLNNEHTKWDKENNLIPFIISACVARLTNAGMYFQLITMTNAYRRHFIAVAMSQLIAAFIYLSTILFDNAYKYYYIYWVIALFSERVFVMSYIYFFVPKENVSFRAPWHMGHLIEREVNLKYIIIFFMNILFFFENFNLIIL